MVQAPGSGKRHRFGQNARFLCCDILWGNFVFIDRLRNRLHAGQCKFGWTMASKSASTGCPPSLRNLQQTGAEGGVCPLPPGTPLPVRRALMVQLQMLQACSNKRAMSDKNQEPTVAELPARSAPMHQ